MSKLRILPYTLAALIVANGSAALAERADRGKRMTLESDQPCTVNLLQEASVCSGNVVFAQGTLQIRADRLELRKTPEGYEIAQAIGSAARPATYRQKRDGVDEVVEGQSQRIDYDSRAGTLRFAGQAVVRRLRGSAVADEIQGALIVWDSVGESFSVQGGATTAANPGGRVRAVLSPQRPAEAASSPRAADAAAATSLRPSTALGDRR
jgi:lipopolysaccharide export system protein LptA